jgi:hypothetical protein
MVTKLVDAVGEDIQQVHFHKVEIHYIDKMLCNFCHAMHYILIILMVLCRAGRLIQSWVTFPFVLFPHSQQPFYGFQHILCTFTGAESTQNFLLTMILLQIIPHLLDGGFSTIPVLCLTVTTHQVGNAQQGVCERNPFAHRVV